MGNLLPTPRNSGMSGYCRANAPAANYFVTIVTHRSTTGVDAQGWRVNRVGNKLSDPIFICFHMDMRL